MTDVTHWVGSRQLLRRLRDDMARGGYVLLEPGRAPEAVIRMTLGPGENSPAKTKG